LHPVVAAFLIALREGLEASLIIGIVFSFLRKTGQTRYRRYAWAGVGAALALSALVALGIQSIGAKLEGPAEQIFEGTMMLLATLVLTWMIYWMKVQARSLRGALESELAQALEAGSPRSLFAVTFFAVVREGVEMALLLAATAFVTNGMDTLIGSLLGLGAAALTGVLLYASVVRLNIRMFFSVSSVLLLLFAAGLFASSLHEFQEAGLLLTIQEHIWDVSRLLSAESPIGQVLRALFGYNPSPSLVEVIGYGGYWAFALLAMPWLVERRVRQRAPVALASGRSA
jgi:high-affinity iron transporter